MPYRTLPLVQPTAKPYSGDLGPGSIIHLRMQDEHISGVREPKASPESQALAAKAKHDEIVMRQKVTGSLQQIQQNQNSANSARLPSPNPELINRQYNSPLPLYSAENVQEAMMPQVSPSHTPTIKPVNKPNKQMGLRGMPLSYDPEQSATWQIIHEEENCQLITEHGPTESKVYSI